MRKLPIIGLAALSALALACGVDASDKGTTQGPGVAVSEASGGATVPAAGKTDTAAKQDDGKRNIVFEVVGKNVGTATSISYGVGGNTSQANGAKLPWKKEATSTDRFLLLSLVAQSGSGGSGSITCRITVDGKVIVENTSEGQYAVVTCSESA